jgi:hypothetical protein
MNDDRAESLRGKRYALATVERGELVEDLSLMFTYSSEHEATCAAREVLVDVTQSGGAVPGEGFWLFEIKPVRFVGQ